MAPAASSGSPSPLSSPRSTSPLSQSQSQSQSSTTIPVSSDITYTSTLPRATTIALLSHLKATHAIPDLAETLHESLARTGWTDRIRSLALELLHNGSCSTYPELLSEVLRRAKVPKPETLAVVTNGTTGGKRVNGAGAKTTNGVNGSQGSGAGGAGHTAGNGSISVRDGWFDDDGLPDVRIPSVTVEAGVEFLKERIAEVVEVVEDDSD